MRGFFKKKEGELVWDTLIPWIIGVGVLVLFLLLYLVLSGKLQGMGTYISNLLRFGK